jgi:hypothetical protein
VVGLQTNDTLFVGDNDFAESEQLKLKEAQFLAKEQEQLTFDHDLKFNGGIIHAETTETTKTTETTITTGTEITGITLTQER